MAITRQLLARVPGAWRVGLAPRPKLIRRLEVLRRHLALGGVGAEIGVDRGDFSEQLLKHLKPRELHLIDPWRYQGGQAYLGAKYGGLAVDGQQSEMDMRYEFVKKRFATQAGRDTVVIHRMTSEEALVSFPDNYFDWVYIDGNHLYEFVKKDIELSLKKVRPSGIVSGDDYREGGWWEGGVKKAVDEIAFLKKAHLLEIAGKQFVFCVFQEGR